MTKAAPSCARLILKQRRTTATLPWSLLTETSIDDEGGAILRQLNTKTTKDDDSTPLRSFLTDISTDDEGGANRARLILIATKTDGSAPLRSYLTEISTDDEGGAVLRLPDTDNDEGRTPTLPWSLLTDI